MPFCFCLQFVPVWIWLQQQVSTDFAWLGPAVTIPCMLVAPGGSRAVGTARGTKMPEWESIHCQRKPGSRHRQCGNAARAIAGCSSRFSWTAVKSWGTFTASPSYRNLIFCLLEAISRAQELPYFSGWLSPHCFQCKTFSNSMSQVGISSHNLVALSVQRASRLTCNHMICSWHWTVCSFHI